MHSISGAWEGGVLLKICLKLLKAHPVFLTFFRSQRKKDRLHITVQDQNYFLLLSCRWSGRATWPSTTWGSWRAGAGTTGSSSPRRASPGTRTRRWDISIIFASPPLWTSWVKSQPTGTCTILWPCHFRRFYGSNILLLWSMSPFEIEQKP